MFLQSRRECRTQWSQRSRPVVLKWLNSDILVNRHVCDMIMRHVIKRVAVYYRLWFIHYWVGPESDVIPIMNMVILLELIRFRRGRQFILVFMNIKCSQGGNLTIECHG